LTGGAAPLAELAGRATVGFEAELELDAVLLMALILPWLPLLSVYW